MIVEQARETVALALILLLASGANIADLLQGSIMVRQRKRTS
jgi:hypothetical protein